MLKNNNKYPVRLFDGIYFTNLAQIPPHIDGF